MKFLVEIWMDGYDEENEEFENACTELLESLDSAGISVDFERVLDK
jgi:hypothetical protein